VQRSSNCFKKFLVSIGIYSLYDFKENDNKFKRCNIKDSNNNQNMQYFSPSNEKLQYYCYHQHIINNISRLIENNEFFKDEFINKINLDNMDELKDILDDSLSQFYQTSANFRINDIKNNCENQVKTRLKNVESCDQEFKVNKKKSLVSNLIVKINNGKTIKNELNLKYNLESLILNNIELHVRF
jgi:hypothetical protein